MGENLRVSRAFNRVLAIAPSSPFVQEEFDQGCATLTSRGFSVDKAVLRTTYAQSYLNGSDAERLDELRHALSDTTHSIVWAARGGYGLTRILPELVIEKRDHFPVVIGFSDTAALLMHLWVHAKIPSIHGTGIARLPKEPSETLDALIQILNGQATQINYPSLRALNDLPPPDLTGTLLACNLCVLTDIVGTASMPDLSGCILVLEEVNEQPYCIDRMLTQLYHSGSLKGVLAIIVGHLTSCVSIKQPTTAIDVFIERTKAFGIPLVGQIPVGHESPNWPIPIGVKARLESAHGHYQLRVLSEIVV